MPRMTSLTWDVKTELTHSLIDRDIAFDQKLIYYVYWLLHGRDIAIIL